MNWSGEAYFAAVLYRDKLHRPAESGEAPNLQWLRRWLFALREAIAVKYCTYRAIPAQECLA
jgi:hypothetical protein